MASSTQESEWGRDNMKANEYQISAEKFKLINENRPLHDKELVTKPIGYFRDALNRFAKNKGSVAAAIIIGILVLYAIIAPIASPYTVSYNDPIYAYVLPKTHLTQNINFLDGCSNKTFNEASFLYYYSMGTETGHYAFKNNQYTPVKTINNKGKEVTMYNVRLDSYHKVGTQFLSGVTLEEYQRIQTYQDLKQVQVIYPITRLADRPENPMDLGDANFWFKTKKSNGITVPDGAVINPDGTVTYENIYAAYTGNDSYTSNMRIEGKGVYTYNYARLLSGGSFEIRVNYYEYYKYIHTYANPDGISEPFFIFGTTNLGKDIFTCLASGARFSFILAVIVASVNLIVGAIYGAIEGYYGGKTDLIMERIVEILSAVPFMIVITLLKYHMENTNHALLLFISFFLTGWIGMSGTVRMQFYRFKNQEYVLAARTLGAKDPRIMFKHIFPNALGTIVTSSVLVIPGVIFSETSLSYLGIINLETGSTTSVGTLLAGGQPYLTTYPHMIIYPAIFISLLMLSFNLFGNGLRDAFNPSLRGTED